MKKEHYWIPTVVGRQDVIDAKVMDTLLSIAQRRREQDICVQALTNKLTMKAKVKKFMSLTLQTKI
ncbi:hypothetical protein Pyn_06894 [Prunus yedoensis var. nudiflora]|uniref:Uncharacterized protein n=1 Tax=Prunus yedoensis var. nudiflora TaxID=2094558 RepID=A0A314YZ03_PRUYE|nr:hypothetical protein Pyn_06894 [Prunus yedoensis var. nudiflora]